MKFKINGQETEIVINGVAVSPRMHHNFIPQWVKDLLISEGYYCKAEIDGEVQYFWSPKGNDEFVYQLSTQS